jgi:tRNA A-37 threonylcarbamoyl transferase component Bud32
VPTDDDATQPATVATADPARRISDVGIDRRYDIGAVLGRGGMGEVRLARDQRIHRDVAVKLMRSATTDAITTARFLREAQVQGALEHPAIPPVHDLGIDRDGQPYFVMKKLAGTTLGEVLDKRTSSDALMVKWPRRLLLARLVDVCLAVELAHTRGVVHRDLKPANIMLGDFGETYVLDWGLARITDDQFAQATGMSIDATAGQTIAGALLGTPGYMAPEQVRGEDVDARADVFALGCILFEILTGVPALPRGLPALDATINTLEHRPSKRVDVPPELDELCARATAQERGNRPTARQLADAIQAYLDGDRDLEARRTLAVEHVALATARIREPGDEARAAAMREASRALALDPTNTQAQELVARLVIEPPKVPPAAAIAQADNERGKARARVFIWASGTYASLIGVIAVLFVFPVHHAWPILTTMGLLAAMSILFAYLSRKVLGMKSPWFALVILLNTLTMMSASFILGPMMVLPIFLIGSLAGYIMAPTAYSPVIVVGAHITAFLLPVGLELTRVTPSTFGVVNGQLVLTPWALELTPTGAIIILIAATLAQVAHTTMIGLSERRGQERALDQVHVQSWHLQQLVPRDKDK